jgi:hypothetical protein
MAAAYTTKRVIHHNTMKSLLDGVVRWLKTGPSPNDAEWQAHTDLVQVCLVEMVEMSVNPSNGASSRSVQRPVANKLNRAMPHVRYMLTAMWDRDRTTALAHGETTLQRLFAGTQAVPVFRSRKIIITEALPSACSQ